MNPETHTITRDALNELSESDSSIESIPHPYTGCLYVVTQRSVWEKRRAEFKKLSLYMYMYKPTLVSE